MAAIAGVWNQAAGIVNPSPNANPMNSTQNATDSSVENPSTISANDFLTLLVTEMKNQDPTANTDPNQYVNQLVQVNSLEQLININQTLSTTLGSSDISPTGKAVNSPHALNTVSAATAPASAVARPASAQLLKPEERSEPVAAKTMHGNLDAPDMNAAAQRVAQALGGHN